MAVLWVRRNSRFLVVFWNVLQSPKICSKGSCPLAFPRLSISSRLSKSVFPNKDRLAPAWHSSILSKFDNKSPTLLVKMW